MVHARVYLWNRKVCNCVIYVRETVGLYTSQRIQNHLSTKSVESSKICGCKRAEMEVTRHFNERDNNIGNVKVVGLEQVWKNWVTYRRVREQR